MSKSQIQTQAQGLPSSSTSTPPLSASASQDVSPAFTVLESPALRPDEMFDLGQPALPLQENKAVEGTVPAPLPQIVGKGREERVPECWGHRGASVTYPENTRASFLEACAQGADGIETDIHITSDNVLVLFHDPKLDRTTDGKGRIREQSWKGVLEHVRTTKTPIQPIPLFTEVLDILCMEGNEKVKLNLDCKVDNDAEKLFTLVKAVVEGYPDWQEKLAPRIVLGLWHPKFLIPASRILPYLPRYAITMSLSPLKQFFWPLVHGFSVYYPLLATSAGQQFLFECKAANKGICAWTVNTPEGMKECTRWNVDAIISDKPDLWRAIKKEVVDDRAKALKPTWETWIAPWVNKRNWSYHIAHKGREEHDYLVKEGGEFRENWNDELEGDVVVLPESVTNEQSERI